MIQTCAIRPATAHRVAFRTPNVSLRRPTASGTRRLLLRASAEQNGAGQMIKYEHILLAILDSNPHLSSASRNALATAATIAAANKSKFTIVFVDEQGKKLNGQRLNRVQGELLAFGIEKFDTLEEEIEPSVGKGSVAVGDVADQIDADLLVLSTDAIHSKHVDANLLAEFVPCPVLLLP